MIARSVTVGALLIAVVCHAVAQGNPAQAKPVQPKPAPPAKITLEQAGSRTGRDRVPAYEGQDVVVTGQVSTRPIWITDSYYVAIQDDAFFGLLLRPEIPQLPDLTPGDWVEAQGIDCQKSRLADPGAPRLSGVCATRRAPAPKVVTPLDLASFRYMGVLVTLENIVTGEDQNGGGDLLSIGPADQRVECVPAPDAAGLRPQAERLSHRRSHPRHRHRQPILHAAALRSLLPDPDSEPGSVAVLERGWAIQPPVLLASLILAVRAGFHLVVPRAAHGRRFESRCGCSIRWASR